MYPPRQEHTLLKIWSSWYFPLLLFSPHTPSSAQQLPHCCPCPRVLFLLCSVPLPANLPPTSCHLVSNWVNSRKILGCLEFCDCHQLLLNYLPSALLPQNSHPSVNFFIQDCTSQDFSEEVQRKEETRASFFAALIKDTRKCCLVHQRRKSGSPSYARHSWRLPS